MQVKARQGSLSSWLTLLAVHTSPRMQILCRCFVVHVVVSWQGRGAGEGPLDSYEEAREERRIRREVSKNLGWIGRWRGGGGGGQSGDEIHFPVPFSALCLSSSVVIVASEPLGWGGGRGALTGACSYAIPVARGEEWPPFPPRVLSSPPGWRACLFVFQ